MSGFRDRLVALALMVGALAAGTGCAATMPSTYTEDELRARCVRTRGVWHADALMGGFCEYRAA